MNPLTPTQQQALAALNTQIQTAFSAVQKANLPAADVAACMAMMALQWFHNVRTAPPVVATK